jgi:DGQHR domain-containing protein
VSDILKRRALQLRQHPNHPVYIFSLRPAEVMQVAAISRIGRDNSGDLIGYQRGEVRQHVGGILEYLDSGPVLFPNAIILSFNEAVRFKSSRGPGADDGLSRSGTLEIPLFEDENERSAWIVDGQQRALALSRTSNLDLAVPVVGFVGGEVKVQRDQFLRVNNTKPLPRGLITELLPAVDTTLPRRLALRKLPSAICDRLNRIPKSPFHELIRRTSTQGEEAKRRAIIKDTSIIEMIRDRIKSPNGCLFPYHNMATGETESEAVLKLLIDYWSAVRDTFPKAWGIPPKQSRLMGGVGIRSLGNVMDTIMGQVNPGKDSGYAHARRELAHIAPICRWTGGVWEGLGDLHWKAMENTTRSIRLLTNHLMREYHRAVRRR